MGFFMKTFGFMLGALLFLSGCVPSMTGIEPRSAVLASGPFDFNWQLSGDPAVAPVQVFSHSQQVWLQFEQMQYLPAIFAWQDGQRYALNYQRFDPYVVIDGSWRELLFQGGHRQARATHASAQQVPPASAPVSPTNHPTIDRDAAPKAHEPTTAKGAVAALPKTDAAPLSLGPLEQTSAVLLESKAIDSPPKDVPTKELSKLHQPSRSKRFSISPSDDTLRQAIQRWAKDAGWDFSDHHWGLEVDYPIINTAQFEGEFAEAVGQLLDSVRMGARPMRACFYSNQVLRIISATQSCHPTGQPNSQQS